MWYILSGDHGLYYIPGLSAVMTPADLSEAQKLARECVRNKYKWC